MNAQDPDLPDRAGEIMARKVNEIRDQVVECLDLVFRRDDALKILDLYFKGDLIFMVTKHGVGFYGSGAGEVDPPENGNGTGLYL